MNRRTWTVERDALFRAELPDNTDPRSLLARLNELPGDPITSLTALQIYAHKKGLRRKPEAALAIQSAAGRAGNMMRATRSGNRIITVWTKERDERLIAGREEGEAPAVTLAALNAMEAEAVASVAALRGRLKKLARERGLRLPKRNPGPPPGTMPKSLPPGRKPAPPKPVVIEPPPPVEVVPCPEIADAKVLSKQEAVRASLRNALGRRGVDISDTAAALAARYSLPLREAFRLLGEVRMERLAA
jgi:hypothetical protein